MNSTQILNRAADNIRILAASAVEKAKSGHPGGAMGGADFVNVLFSEFLVFDPKNLFCKWVLLAHVSLLAYRRCNRKRGLYCE